MSSLSVRFLQHSHTRKWFWQDHTLNIHYGPFDSHYLAKRHHFCILANGKRVGFAHWPVLLAQIALNLQ